MKKLEILKVPNKILENISKDISIIDDSILEITNQMIKLMKEGGGVGLAAPQVGFNINLIVVDSGNLNRNKFVILNPKILHESDEKISSIEGCLSLKNRLFKVERYKKIEIEFMNLKGKIKRLSCRDYLSIIIQHEMDHLQGITLDKLGEEVVIDKK